MSWFGFCASGGGGIFPRLEFMPMHSPENLNRFRAPICCKTALELKSRLPHPLRRVEPRAASPSHTDHMRRVPMPPRFLLIPKPLVVGSIVRSHRGSHLPTPFPPPPARRAGGSQIDDTCTNVRSCGCEFAQFSLLLFFIGSIGCTCVCVVWYMASRRTGLFFACRSPKVL